MPVEYAQKEKKGPLRAKMSVVLKADEVVVAEVEDATLWNAVFAAMSLGASQLPSTNNAGAPQIQLAIPAAPTPAAVDSLARNTPLPEPVDRFASALGIDSAVLIGALDPTVSDPFLRPDIHHWESMRKELPERGPKAVAPIVFAATSLCLWNRHSDLGGVTQAQAQAVLAVLHMKDTNAARGIARCGWLQARPGGQIVLNPAQISKALAVVGAFCTRDWGSWKAA